MSESVQKCSFAGECAFYSGKMREMPSESGFLKHLYCHKLWDKCQRLKKADEFQLSDASNILPPLVVFAPR